MAFECLSPLKQEGSSCPLNKDIVFCTSYNEPSAINRDFSAYTFWLELRNSASKIVYNCCRSNKASQKAGLRCTFIWPKEPQKSYKQYFHKKSCLHFVLLIFCKGFCIFSIPFCLKKLKFCWAIGQDIKILCKIAFSLPKITFRQKFCCYSNTVTT